MSDSDTSQRARIPTFRIAGTGHFSARACNACGRYVNQIGSTVRHIAGRGKVWVGACCAMKKEGKK